MGKTIDLMMPAKATGETRKTFDDIIATWGPRRLVPIWGFFGRDPKVVNSMWTLIKRLKVEPTEIPKKYLFAIALVGAQRSGCDRCAKTHENELVHNEGFDPEFVQLLFNFEKAYEEGKIERELYLAVKFGEKIWFGKEISESEWEEFTAAFSIQQLYEMIMLALIESCLSRYGFVLARFDESIEWPSEHLPGAAYRSVVTR